MKRLIFVTTFLALLMTGINYGQEGPNSPILNNPDDPPCEDPLDTSQCSQDFYWEQPNGSIAADWWEIFRSTESQTGERTAWVLVGVSRKNSWWTANDGGDSERNAQGQVRAGQQKPGFLYYYRVRACRRVPDTWTIVCSAFSQEQVLFNGVTYTRLSR